MKSSSITNSKAWNNAMAECLEGYSSFFNVWYTSARKESESSISATNFRTDKCSTSISLESLQEAHKNFVEKMERIMKAAETSGNAVEPTLESCFDRDNHDSNPPMRLVVAQQVKVIEELHKLLEKAELVMDSLKERVIACEKQLQTHKEQNIDVRSVDLQMNSKPLAKLPFDEEELECIPSHMKQLMENLSYRYPDDSDIVLLLDTLHDSYSTHRQNQKLLRAACQDRLDAEVAWEAKLSGMMQRMEVLENLVKRSSLPEYRRNQKSEERTEVERTEK